MIHIRTRNAPTSYSHAIWIGAVGGAALPTDPDPNVTPPAAGRILRWTAKRGCLMIMGGGGSGVSLRVIQVGGLNVGTNITVAAWIYDDAQSKWIQIGGPANITGTSNLANVGGIIHGNVAGAKYFIQITANAGSTPLLGYDHN